MSEVKQYTGGCLCGALRYTASAAPFAVDYCHCRMCQRSTGSVVGVWMDFKAQQVEWQGRAALQEYASSEFARRGFCATCGSTLSFRDTRHEAYISLAITSLDEPQRVAPTYHIYTDSQLSWLKLSDDCRRYPQAQTK